VGYWSQLESEKQSQRVKVCYLAYKMYLVVYFNSQWIACSRPLQFYSSRLERLKRPRSTVEIIVQKTLQTMGIHNTWLYNDEAGTEILMQKTFYTLRNLQVRNYV
jgi:hypothetical protein